MAITPRQLQEQLNKISDESFEKHQRLAELSMIAAEKKLELMRTCKNGKEVDMTFDATKEGKEITFLTIYLKGLSHKRTALISEAKANAGGSW
jgi:uncharacterized protein YxeA